jgi:solute carrier family 10 (sodium/bile acid cotransporter), member 7
MSVEINNLELFSLVWLGHESETMPKLEFTKKFPTLTEFEDYHRDKSNTHIILVLSKSMPLDNTWMDLPQICVIFNEQLVCLHCVPTMALFAHVYMKDKAPKKPKCWLLRVGLSHCLTLLRKYWFLVGLGCAIGVAYAFPDLGKTGGHIRSEWSVKWGCVIVIFFLSGLSLRTKVLAKEMLHINLHAVVQIYSLLIIPFTVYGLGLLLSRLPLDKTLVTGIVIMACTPTTISSNVVMTKNAMGNEYSALVNAAVGNLIGIFVSPALVSYFMKNPTFNTLSKAAGGQIDYGSIMKNLGLTVLVPLFVGQIIQLIWTKRVARLKEKFYFSEVNSVALLILIWSVFCTAVATKSFQKISGKDLVALIIINAGLYILFSLMVMMTARIPIRRWQFSRKDTVAMMFCGATKTVAMGVPLINTLYSDGDQKLIGVLSLPLIMYHIIQLVLGAFEVMLLKRWVKAETQEQPTTLNDTVNNQENKVVEPEVCEMNTINESVV